MQYKLCIKKMHLDNSSSIDWSEWLKMELLKNTMSKPSVYQPHFSHPGICLSLFKVSARMSLGYTDVKMSKTVGKSYVKPSGVLACCLQSCI